MIVRIVKLTIDSNKSDLFIDSFNQNKDKIETFPGCSHVKLLQEINSNVFMTYSYWDSEKSLNNYRHSDLFKGIWSNVKTMFTAKPEAWSLVKKSKLHS